MKDCGKLNGQDKKKISLYLLYCLRILASCKNFNFSSWERSSSCVLTMIPILCFNVPLNVSSKFPLPSNYDSFMTEMEKAVAPHSSTLVWKIPWTEEPGGLQSMRLLSRTRLSDFTFTFHFHALEKKMATHSSVLAWGIPGAVEPGGLPSMGSHRVGHD